MPDDIVLSPARRTGCTSNFPGSLLHRNVELEMVRAGKMKLPSTLLIVPRSLPVGRQLPNMTAVRQLTCSFLLPVLGRRLRN